MITQITLLPAVSPLPRPPEQTTANNGTLTLVVTPGASGKAATVSVKGAQNTAKVVAADLVAGNVTIHVIDAVLLPHTVSARLALDRPGRSACL